MGRASFSLGSSQIPRGAEVLGSASKTPFPKGVLSPLPPCPLRHYGALAVQQGAVLAWWQKGGQGLCQGWLLWFLSSVSWASPPVR